MVERYPNPKEEVGGSTPGCEIFSLLHKNLQGDQLPLVLWRWHAGLMCDTYVTCQGEGENVDYYVESKDYYFSHIDL